MKRLLLLAATISITSNALYSMKPEVWVYHVDLLRKEPIEFGGTTASPQLRCAVNTGNMAQLQTLIEKGADPSTYRGTSYDETLLHCAAANGQLAMIEYLVRTIGMNPNCRDRYGATPAHYAASANVTVISRQGASQLAPSEAIKLATITKLKSLGANLRAVDNQRSSIIMDAREEGASHEFIRALAELIASD